MADLDITKASELISITGIDSTGLETNPVNASATGELTTSDISNNGGVNGAIVVGTSSVEAKVGASALSNRKQLIIHHNGSGKLYYGFTSGVTSVNGIPIIKNTALMITVGPGSNVWLISDTAGQDIRIGELA